MNLIFSIKNNNYYFTRGFLYVDEKEIYVHDFKSYSSLQIEDICHDNISVIRIPENLWRSLELAKDSITVLSLNY